MKPWILAFSLWNLVLCAQTDSLGKLRLDRDNLKLNLNEDGSLYFQATFLNQTWLRWVESNPGTLSNGVAAPHTVDLGLRRTRIQLFGQVSRRGFLYFQFGQNNFNAQYTNQANNRKFAAFFHDALCEYRLSQGNQLKVGGGLTIANGLSRFSQPSIGTILTMDVPVFAQATVDQTDEFSRKLSVYARGQLGNLDYRLVMSDPFPIGTNGAVLPALSPNATFAQKGRHKQYQAYLMYQFLEHEPHTTPYMTGTYLGKKKVWNVASGIISQKNATWTRDSVGADTIYHNQLLWCVESFLDIPINPGKGSALSAYAGFFSYDFGHNYLRYNGLMNPATAMGNTNALSGAGPTFGNAFPMFGTGTALYMQLGYLFPKNFLGEKGPLLLPYISAHLASWKRLQGPMHVYHLGVNLMPQGHKTKFSLDYELRPTYYAPSANQVKRGEWRNGLVLQYQIFI
ncbi:MAG: hypothetical protein MUF42_06660 [Cytophagaceae bacterium]|jgi:hypothetical protein|nr:hypothetical protein [Cytophagaceae bacterium]